MSELLVRGLASETIERLKAQAKQHGRSLQGEAKRILEEAVTFSLAEANGVAASWRERCAGQSFSDSAELLREDRQR
ncbi:MAG: FitA-like ribbon-helix-helix domain-containing protein [Gammaproteobacteria bacterium]